jgi:hypothetical protein
VLNSRANCTGGMVAHPCNPGYTGGRNWEDLNLRPALDGGGGEEKVSDTPTQ